jgi:hypothetical protein
MFHNVNRAIFLWVLEERELGLASHRVSVVSIPNDA